MKVTRQQERDVRRLVDGELEFVAVRQMMRAAEQNPDLWRKIATTFVEDQLWRTTFADSVDQTAPTTANSPMTTPANSSRAVHNVRGMRWWSMAAMLALAASVGFLGGRGDFARPIASNTTDAHQAGNDLMSSASPMERVPHRSPGPSPEIHPAIYHMQLEDQQGNRYLDSEIPLYPVNRSTDLRRLEPAKIPREVREQARDSGYQVEQNIRYVSGRLNDGRRFIIPIRNFRFLPNQ